MNKELFSKKLITLRKKYHYTQQDLADKLNISNKTVSRWETGESYPDIELLPILANVLHVSIDYLLCDHEDYQDIDKNDIVSYIPWIMSIFALLIYYIFCNLSVPTFLGFMVYYFIVQFSYYFLKTYTDKKNHHSLAMLNTITSFFVVQNLMASLFTNIYLLTTMGDFYVEATIDPKQYFTFMFYGYLFAAIYAFFHYKNHKVPSK